MSLARRWLTLDQAADVTGRSRRTVERWITDGRLRAVAVGGIRYVRELPLLEVERDTRRAAHAGRPGPRPPANLTSGVVTCGHSRLRMAPDRGPGARR